MNQTLIAIGFAIFGVGGIGFASYLFGLFRGQKQQGVLEQQLVDLKARNEVLRAQAEALSAAPKTPDDLAAVLDKGDV